MLKKLLVFTAVLVTGLCFTTNVLASESLLSEEDSKIISIVEKYVDIENNMSIFDIDKAVENNESDNIIQIGLAIDLVH